jgi:hypothetical protein
MKTRRIIPFVATTTPRVKNYCPPLLQACTDAESLSLPANVNCSQIAWKVYHQSRDNSLFSVLMVIFAKDGNPVGRAKFNVSTNTGIISEFHFEGANGFTLETMFEPHRVHIHELNAKEADTIARLLVHYFAQINATEEAKMKAFKFLSKTESSAAQFGDKSDHTDEYDPNAPLAPTYIGNTGIHHRTPQYTIDETQVRGFYRTYWMMKNGKKVRVRKWIVPHTRHYR